MCHISLQCYNYNTTYYNTIGRDAHVYGPRDLRRRHAATVPEEDKVPLGGPQ